MLQVYLDPCTVNSRKVLAGLELVGMPYEPKQVDYFTGERVKLRVRYRISGKCICRIIRHREY